MAFQSFYDINLGGCGYLHILRNIFTLGAGLFLYCSAILETIWIFIVKLISTIIFKFCAQKQLHCCSLIFKYIHKLQVRIYQTSSNYWFSILVDIVLMLSCQLCHWCWLLMHEIMSILNLCMYDRFFNILFVLIRDIHYASCCYLNSFYFCTYVRYLRNNAVQKVILGF